MIRGMGVETTFTYSQTLNGHEVASGYLIEPRHTEYIVLSGPFLVSRTGDAG